jgi:hypothetical protein
MRRAAWVFMLLFVTGMFAHPGRTDSFGGHYCRKAGWGYTIGKYHYHSGPYTGQEVDFAGQIPNNASFTQHVMDNKIEIIQRNLKKNGYSPGPIDGILGKRTETAMIRYLYDHFTIGK